MLTRLTTATRTIRNDEATGERARRAITHDELHAMYEPGGIGWTHATIIDRVNADLRKPDHFDIINAMEGRGSLMSDAEPLE